MYTLVTPPAEEPLSLEEVKLDRGVDHTDHDAMLSALIVAARQHFEMQTGRSLVAQTWRLDLDAFPAGGGPIRILRGPVAEVVSVAYLDTDGSSQVLAGDQRIDDVGGDIGRILPLVGEPWPVACYRRPAAVSVTFAAGYGDAADVPEAAKVALKMLVGHWYENREAVMVDRAAQAVVVPMAAESLIDSYRIPALA